LLCCVLNFLHPQADTPVACSGLRNFLMSAANRLSLS